MRLGGQGLGPHRGAGFKRAGGLRPVLLAGYQAVRPLPPDYEEHRAALLAARRLYLAIWHLAGGLPDERHLGQLRVFTGN